MFEINKTDLTRYHMVNSSLNALDVCKKIIDEYKNDENHLINVYGLLQALFVGIDALYSLSYGITGNKYMVNVNSNFNLRQIKYIRNDCVGHPTNREYSSYLGYCYLEDIVEDILTYKVYKIRNEKEELINYNVNLLDTIDDFKNESNKIIEALKVIYKKSFKMSDKVLSLYDDILNIDNVIDSYKLYNNLSYDRFMWRLDIVKDFSLLDDEISIYLRNKEIFKIYQMCCGVEKIKVKPYSFKMPKILIDYIKYLKNNNLKFDYEDDCLSSDFNNLLENLKNSNLEIYDYLLKYKNNKNIIYSISKEVRSNL